MKKHLFALLTVIALAVPVWAQTTTPDTNPPPQLVSGPGLDAFNFLTRGSNWIVAPYGAVSLDTHQAGGGIAAGYRLSDFVVPFIRLDYFDGSVIVPNATAQLQVPVKILDTLTLTPLVYTGLGTPISGAAKDNGGLVGIFGAGGAVRIGQHWDILAAYEKRTGAQNESLILFGFGWKPKGW